MTEPKFPGEKSFCIDWRMVCRMDLKGGVAQSLSCCYPCS